MRVDERVHDFLLIDDLKTREETLGICIRRVQEMRRNVLFLLMAFKLCHSEAKAKAEAKTTYYPDYTVYHNVDRYNRCLCR